jgi:hypothetical protein
MLYSTIVALIVIALGAFVGFSYSGSVIDYENRKVRYVNYFFGLFPVGDWIVIKPGMRIGLVFSSKTWRTFSQANRAVDIVSSDIRIVLFDRNNRVFLHIKKYKDKDLASNELKKYSYRLNVEVR